MTQMPASRSSTVSLSDQATADCTPDPVYIYDVGRATFITETVILKKSKKKNFTEIMKKKQILFDHVRSCLF